MVWVSFPNTTARRPAKELKGFARVRLAAGEEKQITIPVRLSDLDYFKVEIPERADRQVGRRDRRPSRSWSAAARTEHPADDRR